MRNFKSLACAGAILAASALGGCTQDEQAAADAALSQACAEGATIGISAAGPGGVAFGPLVGALAPGACAAIVALAQAEVNKIVASGGTAVVSVTPAPKASLRRMTHRGIVKSEGTTRYIVTPNGLVLPGF